MTSIETATLTSLARQAGRADLLDAITDGQAGIIARLDAENRRLWAANGLLRSAAAAAAAVIRMCNDEDLVPNLTSVTQVASAMESTDTLIGEIIELTAV